MHLFKVSTIQYPITIDIRIGQWHLVSSWSLEQKSQILIIQKRIWQIQCRAHNWNGVKIIMAQSNPMIEFKKRARILQNHLQWTQNSKIYINQSRNCHLRSWVQSTKAFSRRQLIKSPLWFLCQKIMLKNSLKCQKNHNLPKAIFIIRSHWNFH